MTIAARPRAIAMMISISDFYSAPRIGSAAERGDTSGYFIPIEPPWGIGCVWVGILPCISVPLPSMGLA